MTLDLRARYIFASDRFLVRLVKAYGTDSFTILGDAESKADLGRLFGWDLYEKEVKWLMAKEYARTADDIVWRRSKLGLRLSENEIADLEHWMQTEGLMTLNQASGVKV